MYMTITFMVHSSLHYTYHGADDISLWSFSFKNAVWLQNRLPNYHSVITPREFLAINKADHRYLIKSHVWGCPVFVLEPKLQNYQKIPKWNQRSCLENFLGFSQQHFSFISNVRHLKIGHISPQYHVF